MERITTAWISLAVGTALMLLKFWAFNMTESKAILSDALESIVNVVAALIALIVIRISAKPADKDHPYGHGKAEYFSMAFEGGLITFAALAIYYESIRSLFKGVQLERLTTGLLIVVGCGIANGLLGLYILRKGKKLNSLTLTASGTHILADFWTTVGLAIGLFLVHATGWQWLDPVTAIIYGSILLYSGYKIVRQSMGGLMDEEDFGVIEKVGNLFQKHAFPGIIRIHHTRVMRSGSYHHIDAHVVVPEYWDVEKAHDETSRFEKSVIKEYYSDGEIHFHIDPCRQAYCEACDVTDCPVRKKAFKERIPFTLEELTDPDEPEEFRVST